MNTSNDQLAGEVVPNFGAELDDDLFISIFAAHGHVVVPGAALNPRHPGGPDKQP